MKNKSFNIASDKDTECVFCSPKSEILIENTLSYVIYDKFPVSKGHSLIIPKSHVSDYFDLSIGEQTSMTILINRWKKIIDEKFRPDGYNIGVNIGVSGGQTVNHVHIHLIPRYNNDVNNPIGGVRNVIPLKADYISKR